MKLLLAMLLLLPTLVSQAPATSTPAPATPTNGASTIALGQLLLGQGKFAEAAAVFADVVRAQPQNGQAWFFKGYALHAAGDLEQALEGHLMAVQLKFNVSGAAYNAACVYALQGEKESALDWLQTAWAAGYADPNALLADTDLISLHAEPRLQALLDAMRQTVSRESIALGEISTLGDSMLGIGGGIVIANDGTRFVADFLDTIYREAPGGAREVFAKDIATPSGIALDSQGRVYQSAFKSGELLRFSASGDEREVLASGIPGPVGLVLDERDRVYVTSCHSGSIHTLSPDGELELLVESELFNCANGITRDEQGVLYVSNFNDGLVLRVDPNGEVTALAALPGANNGHITYRHGFLWVAAMTANQLYRVSLDGEVRLFAGSGAPGSDDGPGLRATLFKPNAMAFDAAGTSLYWNDQVPVSLGAAGGAASAGASASASASASANATANANANANAPPSQRSVVRRLELRDDALSAASRGPRGGELTRHGPSIVGGTGGVALTPGGDVLVADFVSTVYRVDPAGELSVFADKIAVPSGLTVDAQGRVYQSAFGTHELLRFAADGSGREVLASGLNGPVGVTLAPSGDAYITSCNGNTIQRLTPEGALSTFAASPLLNCPNGVCFDDAGNLYTCNFNDGWVLRVTPEGEVQPFADIPGGNNGHIAFHDGALYVAAKKFPRVYRLGLDGALTALAGTGEFGERDGPALRGTITRPNGLAISPDGSALYFNDHLGDAVNAYARGPSALRKLSLEATR